VFKGQTFLGAMQTEIFLPNFESIDDTLFERLMHNPYHVIHHLLPPRRELSYNIRQRHHDRQLDIIFGQ